MNFKWRVVAMLILLVQGRCLGQTGHHDIIGQIAEYIVENMSDDLDYMEITERLSFYMEHPININKAGRDQFKDLLFLSPIQVSMLIAHREESGLFQSVLELQSIDGFNEEIARWLSNFLTVDPQELLNHISLAGLLNESQHDLIVRFGHVLEKQAGYLSAGTDSRVYAGSPLRVFARYRYSYGKRLFAFLNMEKDAGEPFFRNSGKGFDFYSANIFLKGERWVKKLVAGDYTLQFGEGLTMWSGLGFGKGATLTNFAKQDMGLRPYSSVNEFSVLRGLAATIGLNRLSFTPFISYKKIDASLSDDAHEIRSLAVSGLHRSDREIQNKNNVSQLLTGLNAQCAFGGLNLGLTAYRTSLDKPIAKGSLLYEKHDFNGKSLYNIGVNYNYTFKNTYLFGETAYSLSEGASNIHGLLSSVSDRVSLALLYRSYAPNYQSFFSQAFSESTSPVNEQGLCSGLNIKLHPKLELTGYVDYFQFPWLKFRVDAPSRGHEFLVYLAYSVDKRFKASLRFREQVKEENTEGLSGGLDQTAKQNYRVELNYKISNSFSLRNRAEVSSYRKGSADMEYGFLTYQDVIYDPLNSRVSGNLRLGIFDTSGFNTRIYTYENDVLYSYSIPAYQGRGVRLYINGRYTLKRGIDLWLRYAVQNLTNGESIGSGYEMISGNKRSDIKLQLRARF